MKNILHRLFIGLAAALVAAGTCSAAPVGVPSLTPQPAPDVERVRLVCDQDCRCWRTGYVERGYARKIEYRERQDANFCPGGGYYNGHYRTGPGTGLSFESRLPVRSLPFPF
jgi:hypothetical protein